MPLDHVSNEGGDQEVFGRTGEVVPLITLDADGTTVRLAGGGSAPGIAYHLFAYVRTDHSADTFTFELLHDGVPVGIRSEAEWGDSGSRVEAQILVPAHGPDATVQVRISGKKPDTHVTVQDFYLTTSGTLGN